MKNNLLKFKMILIISTLRCVYAWTLLRTWHFDVADVTSVNFNVTKDGTVIQIGVQLHILSRLSEKVMIEISWMKTMWMASVRK